MECPKCHTNLNQGENKCPNCGWSNSIENVDTFFENMPTTPITDTVSQNSSINNENQKENEKPVEVVSQEQPTNQEETQGYHLDKVLDDQGNIITIEQENLALENKRQLQAEKDAAEQAALEEQNHEYDYDEYDLLASYIGKNSDKITDEGFSFAAFFLRSIYLMYRKCYLYAIGVFALNIIAILIVFLTPVPTFIASIVNIIISVVIGILFKKTYINNCIKKIKKIISKNERKSFTEVSKICQKKGGVSVAMMVLLGILEIIVIYIVVAFILLNTILEIIDDNRRDYAEKNMKKYIEAVEQGYKDLKDKSVINSYQGQAYSKLGSTSIETEDGKVNISIQSQGAEPTVDESNILILKDNGEVSCAHIKFESYYAYYNDNKITLSKNNDEVCEIPEPENTPQTEVGETPSVSNSPVSSTQPTQ